MSQSDTSLLQLAHTVALRAASIDTYLRSNSLPQPSFAEDAPSPDFLPVEDDLIQDARFELIEAARALADLVAGPKQLLIEKSMFVLHDPWTLQAIYRYKLAQCVPLRGKVTFESISEASGLELDKCRRILRYAMLNRIFCEPNPGFVSHSALSRMLMSDTAAMDWVGHNTDVMYPGTAKEVDALDKWPCETDGAAAGVPLALGHDGPFFSWIGADGERARRFGGAMKFVGQGGGRFTTPEPMHGFDWAKLGKATVIDMGGSTGHISTKLAQQIPELSFVVQDLPEVIERQPKVPEGLEDRLRYEVHNFFEPQPIKDADVYFFRKVFHDWSDEVSTKIIENLVPSMKPGSRFILNENILPDPGDKSHGTNERMMRVLDLQMMTALNARERSLNDWVTLVAAASKNKLRFESAKKGVLSFVCV